MNELLKDLRYALRMAAGSPLVSGIAVVSLAVALAANITIFTVVNAVFLRGLPVDRPAELMALHGTDAKLKQQGTFIPISRPNFEDYRDRSEVFSGLVNLAFFTASLSFDGGEPQQMPVHLVSANYFEVMGVRPELGRFFLAEEDEAPGRNPVAVLTHQTWRDRFGGDAGVVGRTIALNSHPFTVSGVAPRRFDGPVVLAAPALWVPTMSYGEIMPPDVASHWTNRRALLTFAAGRLKPGIDRRQAETSLRIIGKALEAEYPAENEARNVGLLPLAQVRVPPPIRAAFVAGSGLLMVVVGLVLLIACANVANLLLARAMARRTEIAVRLSMGAGRGRLVRQLLVESLVLGLSATALGLLLASWARTALWASRPPLQAQTTLDLSFDPPVLLFTLGLGLATTLFFGLVPALQATRPVVMAALKLGSGMASGRKRWFSLRHLLVGGQVALSLVALVLSGLFLRSLGNATQVDPGFDAERVVVVPLNATAVGYDLARADQFFDTVVERVRELPGVESTALATDIPLVQPGFLRTIYLEGRDPKAENNAILTSVNPTGEGYFKTLGIPLLAGRDFSRDDRPGASMVVILNESAAKRYWPGEEPLGKRLHFFGSETLIEVVGLVKDSKVQQLGEEDFPYIYLPRRQHAGLVQNLFVRAAAPAGGDTVPTAAILAQARDLVRSLEPRLPLVNLTTLADGMQQSLWGARLAAGLLGLFGLLALLLALAGIYGVMAYSVGERHREIGIRLALGAQGRTVVEMLLKQGMLVVGVGLGLGLGLAALLSRFAARLLFGLSSTDAFTFTLTTVLLAAVAFLATLVPARRATAVDPVTVLKGEA